MCSKCDSFQPPRSKGFTFEILGERMTLRSQTFMVQILRCLSSMSLRTAKLGFDPPVSFQAIDFWLKISYTSLHSKLPWNGWAVHIKKNHPGCLQYSQIQKRGRHNDQSRPCHPPSDSGLSMLPSALTCHWRVSCKPLSLGWVYSVWNLKFNHFNPSFDGANPGIHQKARHNPVLCLMMVDDGWWFVLLQFCWLTVCLKSPNAVRRLCMKGRRQLATCQLKTESPPQKSWWKHLWQDTDQNPLKHQVNHCKKHHEENQQASNNLHGRLHWGLTKALAGK